MQLRYKCDESGREKKGFDENKERGTEWGGDTEHWILTGAYYERNEGVAVNYRWFVSWVGGFKSLGSMSRSRGELLHPVNITKQKRIGAAQMDGRDGELKERELGRRSDKEMMIFQSSLSVCWQVKARTIKELENVRGGGCNDSLLTLAGRG